jgi:hypothetical protein
MGVVSILTITGCLENKDFTVDQGNAKVKRILLFFSLDEEKPSSIIKEYEYDEDGRISKTTSPMYQDGVIVGTISYDLYFYDSSDRLIRKENYNANLNAPSGFINLINYIYEYSTAGLKTKETVEYPIVGTDDYSFYEYKSNQLYSIKKYDKKNVLEIYVLNDYDSSDRLIKETTYSADDRFISSTVHTYKGQLQIKSDVYSGNAHMREIKRTFDSANRLRIYESKELQGYSSAMSYILKYEYFD